MSMTRMKAKDVLAEKIFCNRQKEDGLETGAILSKYLTFSIAKEIFCIGLNSVLEMIAIRKITQVPFMPNYVTGVINLKGRIIPIIDLRIQLNYEEKKFNEWVFVIIVNVRGSNVGLKVDSVLNIVNLKNSEIEILPHFNNNVMGIGKVKESSKILVNAEEILPLKELSIIKENIDRGILINKKKYS